MKETDSTAETHERGFSLLELLIAMTVTLAVMAAAGSLLATSLRIRSRENTRSSALAAAQRALNIMSREISNSGYGLDDNGIVSADSGNGSIRIRANLDNDFTLADPDEDIHYIYQLANKVIVRFDSFPAPTGNTTVLADGIDSLSLSYWDVDGVAITDPANCDKAERITIDVGVILPPGPEQPASTVRLVSDVALRNAPNTLAKF